MKIESISIHRVDGWGVIYVNGEATGQEHNIGRRAEELLGKLCREHGVTFESEYHEEDAISEMVEGEGRFPTRIQDLYYRGE